MGGERRGERRGSIRGRERGNAQWFVFSFVRFDEIRKRRATLAQTDRPSNLRIEDRIRDRLAPAIDLLLQLRLERLPKVLVHLTKERKNERKNERKSANRRATDARTTRARRRQRRARRGTSVGGTKHREASACVVTITAEWAMVPPAAVGARRANRDERRCNDWRRSSKREERTLATRSGLDPPATPPRARAGATTAAVGDVGSRASTRRRPPKVSGTAVAGGRGGGASRAREILRAATVPRRLSRETLRLAVVVVGHSEVTCMRPRHVSSACVSYLSGAPCSIPSWPRERIWRSCAGASTVTCTRVAEDGRQDGPCRHHRRDVRSFVCLFVHAFRLCQSAGSPGERPQIRSVHDLVVRANSGCSAAERRVERHGGV